MKMRQLTHLCRLWVGVLHVLFNLGLVMVHSAYLSTVTHAVVSHT